MPDMRNLFDIWDEIVEELEFYHQFNIYYASVIVILLARSIPRAQFSGPVILMISRFLEEEDE